MKRATIVTIFGAVVATVAVCAAARGRQHVSPAATSQRHVAHEHIAVSRVASLESPPAPPVAPTDGTEPRARPEAIDWGNPYDLMLHGIPLGRTRDMRQR
jgi:hypothetical protein